MVLDLYSERALLARRILQVEDMRLLHQIQQLLDEQYPQKEGAISIEQYNAEIEQGVSEIECGLSTDQDMLMEEIAVILEPLRFTVTALPIK